MDIISHGLWGSIVSRKRSILIGFLIGALPDIIAMGGTFGWRPYLVAHSLIGLLLVAVLTRAFFHTWVYSGAYCLHLFFDVLTHVYGTRPLFYVPFLWKSFDPIGFHGWSWWGEGEGIEIANIIILTLIITIFVARRAAKKGKFKLRFIGNEEENQSPDTSVNV